jgi:hypothetical protein
MKSALEGGRRKATAYVRTPGLAEPPAGFVIASVAANTMIAPISIPPADNPAHKVGELKTVMEIHIAVNKITSRLSERGKIVSL